MGAGNDGQVQLDELNKLIAEEKGITVLELSNLEQPKADASTKKITKSKK